MPTALPQTRNSSPAARSVGEATIAVCPVAAAPNKVGPPGQERPKLGDGAFSAAMDTQSGRIVVVDAASTTWALDVCTNTWKAMKPSAEPFLSRGSRLVYDADYDVVVGFDARRVWTYSVDTNVWSQLPTSTPAPYLTPSSHLVYDSASARTLVLDPSAQEMWAYSLEEDAWAEIEQGELTPGRGAASAFEKYVSLVVFDEVADQVVLAPADQGGRETWTFDPRAHVWTKQASGLPEMGFGWVETNGPVAFDKVHGSTVAFSLGTMATYKQADGAWRSVKPGSGWASGITTDPSDPVYSGDFDGPLCRLDHTLVYDPVNQRIVMLGGVARVGQTEANMWQDLEDVWAYDLSDNTWLQLVPPREPAQTLFGTWANASSTERFTLDDDGTAEGSILLDRPEDWQGASDFSVDKYVLGRAEDQPTITLFSPEDDKVELYYELEGDTLSIWNDENTTRTYTRR